MGHTIQGKQVGNIGFGLMGLTWRPTPLPDEQAFAAIRAAVEAGCTYFNAGEFYGPADNNSLTLLNKYLAQHPEDADKIVVNVKGCMDFAVKHGADGSPAGVRTSVENCVRMLGGRGRIDQFEPARKDKDTDIEVTVAALQEQVEKGNIGGITLSEVSAATIRRAAKVAKIEGVEVELSLWCTEPLENGVAAACAELDIPIIAYSPLGKGMLTGKVNSPEDLPEGIRGFPRFHPDVFDINLQLVKEVQKLAAKKGCTPGQVAIGWVLALGRQPGMPKIIPIPGASAPERVRENAVEVELTDDEIAELDRLMKKFPAVGTRYPGMMMGMLDTSTE